MNKLLANNFERLLPQPIKSFLRIVKRWEDIKLDTSKSGGIAIRQGHTLIGEVHAEGMLHLVLPQEIIPQLVQERRCLAHHRLSDWVSVNIQTAFDVEKAIWITRLAYWLRLQYLSENGHLDDYAQLKIVKGLSELTLSKEMSQLIF